ncbi:MAG: Txe/YoeB family addiction module toxin [Oligoflexus sp.]|nr:Txe/YoeB family addiction module toxin [Pseudopedobacter sp.]
MGRYSIDIEKKAKKQLAEIYKSGNKTDINILETIFLELQIHPMTGIGNPEQLKHQLSRYWSRKINSKDRLIYKIEEQEVIVFILSAKGHYFGK